MKQLHRLTRIMAAAALLVALPLSAGATLRKEGSWPASDKKVSLEFEGKPSEGLSKLAEEAGWSLVVSKGIELDAHDVKIDVDDQPADAVLEALFVDSDVVARRSGTLITVSPNHGASPDVAPAPPSEAAGAAPVPPIPTVRGEDRNAFGSSVTVAKGEVVHTLTVTGGSAKIYGTVTGDLIVAGGSAKIEDGGRVVGNATVFGGSLKVERGARVDGDVGIVGGVLKREDGSIVGGKVVDSSKGHGGSIRVSRSDGETETSVSEGKKKQPGRTRLSEAVHDFGQSITNISLLFVLGCVLLALATRKMDTLRAEIASRPMRSFAMGFVGTLGALVGLTALCITVVGIPFALFAALVGVFSVYAAICSVLVTFGAAVAGQRTKNPYIHLLIGCVAFLLVGIIPFVGGFVTFVITMIAIGTLVSTRLAGVVPQRAARPPMV